MILQLGMCTTFLAAANIFVHSVPFVRLSRANRPIVTQRFYKNSFVLLWRDHGDTGNDQPCILQTK